MNKNSIPYQLVCNAENFIEKAKAYGLQVVSYPTLGGIMCWQKGSTLSGNDGAGHVAIVERIDSANQIYTSESAYRGSAFFNSTRTNSNGRWGIGSGYSFRGCIVNPAVGDVHWVEPTTDYKVGTTYTTQVVLKVRTGPGTNYAQKSYSQLTPNAKEHALPNGCLKVGTRVTCQEIRHVGNDIWIRIPSGWIAGHYNGNIYVK